MIRFKATRDGKPQIGLGVSRENVRRLTNGEPILVRGESVGMPELDSILIFFGETEAAMLRDFAEFIGPKTIVHMEGKAHEC
jgi:hypothetical protein